VAAEVARVARSAYRVEAGLIGRDDFPPLGRTEGDVAGAGTRFFGVLRDGAVAAVVEVDASEPDAVEICSLVTAPAHMRAGLARGLMRYVVGTFGSRDLTVSTATANAPALELYSSFGFRETRRWSTPDGFALVTLVRPADAASR
jgi:ribosomal protein S18 acetylase RimI-like enzyme